MLEQLFELLRDERPDALVVAGDVYDRAVPPAEAVALLDDVLTRRRGAGRPARRDRREPRLGRAALVRRAPPRRARRPPARRLARRGRPIELAGKGFVYAAPVVDPEVVRAPRATRRSAATPPRPSACSRASGPTPRRGAPDGARRARVRPGRDASRPTASGPSRSAAGRRPAAALAGFDYVALGHLHAPQEVAPGVRYSGSLLKYSFSEAPTRRASSSSRSSAARHGEDRPARRAARRRPPRGHARGAPAAPRTSRAHERDARGGDAHGRGLRLRREAPARGALRARPERRPQGRSPAAGRARSRQRVDGAGRDDLKLFEAFFETVTGALPGPEHREVFAARARGSRGGRQERAADAMSPLSLELQAFGPYARAQQIDFTALGGAISSSSTARPAPGRRRSSTR